MLRAHLRGMNVGIIDVGSNTVRLLIARQLPDGELETIAAERAQLGLGAQIERLGLVSEPKLHAAARRVGRYAHMARAADCELIDLVVTAPGRQSENGYQLLCRAGTRGGASRPSAVSGGGGAAGLRRCPAGSDRARRRRCGGVRRRRRLDRDRTGLRRRPSRVAALLRGRIAATHLPPPRRRSPVAARHQARPRARPPDPERCRSAGRDAGVGHRWRGAGAEAPGRPQPRPR